MALPSMVTCHNDMDCINDQVRVTSSAALTDTMDSGIAFDMFGAEGYWIFMGPRNTTEFSLFGSMLAHRANAQAFPTKTVRYNTLYNPSLHAKDSESGTVLWKARGPSQQTEGTEVMKADLSAALTKRDGSDIIDEVSRRLLALKAAQDGAGEGQNDMHLSLDDQQRRQTVIESMRKPSYRELRRRSMSDRSQQSSNNSQQFRRMSLNDLSVQTSNRSTSSKSPAGSSIRGSRENSVERYKAPQQMRDAARSTPSSSFRERSRMRGPPDSFARSRQPSTESFRSRESPSALSRERSRERAPSVRSRGSREGSLSMQQLKDHKRRQRVYHMVDDGQEGMGEFWVALLSGGAVFVLVSVLIAIMTMYVKASTD